MNYAKVIGSALQLFPKKINVTLLEVNTNRLLGKCKLPAAALPPAFDRPTTLTINNVPWRVLAADPLTADDFLYSKKLQLHVQPVTQATPNRFFWPTRSDWDPLSTQWGHVLPANDLQAGAVSIGDDANGNRPTVPGSALPDEALVIDRRDWLQLQFLSLQQRDAVDEALQHIRAILDQQTNPLLGYEQQYVRTGIGLSPLALPYGDLQQQLNNPVRLRLLLETGTEVPGGFCLRTDSYTYYGAVHDGSVTSLGLENMEYVDEEIMRVMDVFGLELVDWCRVSRLSAEAGEPPKNEAIDW